jgi:RNA polymerase sigma factor (TIGR02999 family)
LLHAWEAGDAGALDQLMPHVYDELRAIAHRRLLGERDGHTLNTTALVHECFLNLRGVDEPEFRNRSQFYSLAATAMRHILVDYARRRSAQKRGGDPKRVEFVEGEVGTEDFEELLALDEALTRLGARDPSLVSLVEHRFFAGMTAGETAEALGISKRTAERNWARAKTYLFRELTDP